MGRFLKLLLLAVFTMTVGPGHSPAESLEEYRVKVAFIYNFAKFVEWPAEAFSGADSPIVLCILGDDPIVSTIDSIEGKMVGKRKLETKRIKKIEERGVCHMLFLAPSERDRLGHILRALKGSSVLTISTVERFTELGGMIGLVNVDNKIRFAVNLTAVRPSRLEISSKLLKLAESVKEDR